MANNAHKDVSVCEMNKQFLKWTNASLLTAQNNCLRKINEHSLCAFLSHANGAEFVCIEILSDGTSVTGLAHRRVIPAPHLDLADFDVSETWLWALWSNAEGEFSVSNFMLAPAAKGSLQHWVSAAMEPPPDRCCVGNEQGMDPCEAYCSYIFHPGKFDRNVISKALLVSSLAPFKY